MDIFPTVATVAAEEPEIAAKIAHPRTLTWIKPPGNLANQGDKPLNKFSDNFVLNKIIQYFVAMEKISKFSVFI